MSDRDVILDLMERAEERRNANVLTIEAPPLTEWSYDRPVVTRPRSKRGQRRAQERKWWDK
jgi:hypothetical protein